MYNNQQNNMPQNQNTQNAQNSSANNSNTINVPEARAALDNMKYEVANQLGVNLTKGYNGHLTARENGYVGGEMVRRMVENYQRQNSSN